MTSRSRFFALILSFLIGFAIFAGLYTLTKPAVPRAPSSGYQTLAEEYIDAIETFNNTGKVVVPVGAIFSYDGDTVTIKDHDSGAYVTCTFVLNGTVPIHSYTYSVSAMPLFFATLFSVLFAWFCYFAINAYSEGKKFRALNKIKANATYGDSRRFSSNCAKCSQRLKCGCLQCPYAKDCGLCPSTDCIDAFEDMLQENLTFEDKTQQEADDTVQEEPQTEAKQPCEEVFEHTLDESEKAFKCTSDCSHFSKCECLHGCDYVSECHKCPYPGCTHDIEAELLGIKVSDKDSENK